MSWCRKQPDVDHSAELRGVSFRPDSEAVRPPRRSASDDAKTCVTYRTLAEIRFSKAPIAEVVLPSDQLADSGRILFIHPVFHSALRAELHFSHASNIRLCRVFGALGLTSRPTPFGNETCRANCLQMPK